MASLDTSLADGRPPLPWVYELAARLQGEPVAELGADAGVITRSLAGAADLFDLPAVCTSFDATIEAEAAGCAVEMVADSRRVTEGCVSSIDDAFEIDIEAIPHSGRVPAVIEAAARLGKTVESTSVLGGVTGPGVITDHLLEANGETAEEAVAEEAQFTAGEICVEVADAYLDRGADGIVVVEPGRVGAGPEYEEALAPVCNVASHYEARTILQLTEVDEVAIRLAADLDFDLVVGQVAHPPSAKRTAEEAGIRLGIGIPSDRFLDGTEAVQSFVSDLPAGALVSSEGTVPESTDPAVLHDLMGSLN